MRVRKRKNGERRREACRELFLPFDKGQPTPVFPAEIFPDVSEIRLEIGCGKGAFITELAQKHPEIGFLAVERINDVILLAAEKAKHIELHNIKFLVDFSQKCREAIINDAFGDFYNAHYSRFIKK